MSDYSFQHAKESVDTEKFWDGVSKIYSSSDMTHHMADFELNQVLIAVDNLAMKGLSCFGVADGNRDPIQILKFLSGKNKNLPDELLVNDISSNMLEETTNNLSLGDWHLKIPSIKCVHNPLSQIDSIDSKVIDRKMAYIIGVYNADYIRESLELYKGNREVIGDYFTVWPLYLNFTDVYPIIYKGIKLSFKIDDFENYLPIFEEMKKDQNFYAYSLMTDNNFVSHYFDSEKLNSLFSVIFKDYTVTTKKGVNPSDIRYIVNIIQQNNNNTNDYVVTMLNNVLGNIKCDEHILSLQKLFNLYNN